MLGFACVNKSHQGGKHTRVRFRWTKHWKCESTLNLLLISHAFTNQSFLNHRRVHLKMICWIRKCRFVSKCHDANHFWSRVSSECQPWHRYSVVISFCVIPLMEMVTRNKQLLEDMAVMLLFTRMKSFWTSVLSHSWGWWLNLREVEVRLKGLMVIIRILLCSLSCQHFTFCVFRQKCVTGSLFCALAHT